MRVQFCDAMVQRSSNKRMIFLTGDLGFMALEPLQIALGPRFINAGVAEQNMISVAAGMARQRFEVWAYSIAPFCYARPFEQIRNDVAFHGLPVKLVGNGGGYGYGVMGPTHHGIEDCAVLLCLPNMSVFAPVFDEDLAVAVDRAAASTGPSYLRLGRGEKPGKDYETPPYAPWRQLCHGGSDAVVVALGPLAGSYVGALESIPFEQRPQLWAVSELPISRNPMPDALVAQLYRSSILCVAEEHVRRGGLGSELAFALADGNLKAGRFVHLHATAHHYERYGSQSYLRGLSGLGAPSLLAAIGLA